MPSSAVKDIDYDTDREVLYVTFVTSGRRYAYAGVPVNVYTSFRHAFSKGVFFNLNIRDNYACTLVYDPGADPAAVDPIL